MLSRHLVSLAVFGLVVLACHSDAHMDAPPKTDSPCPQECVTAVPCRRGGCSGELFWNGCCPCPDGTVVAWNCPDGTAP